MGERYEHFGLKMEAILNCKHKVWSKIGSNLNRKFSGVATYCHKLMKTINISLPDIYLEGYPAEKNEINRHRIKSNRLDRIRRQGW